MADQVEHLFSHDGFMPHGMCYLWQPGVLGLHLVSDTLITLAYFSIPFTLIYFVRKRRDLQFNWMFVCFAIFIVACGTTHLMEIWTIWHPSYWVSGGVKALTALASVPTAILLVRLVPDALRFPSPSALQHANIELEREVAERQRAEKEVRRINQELEARVTERTRELEALNRSLSESQQLLRAVSDNSEAVIYVKDLAGRYLMVNRRFEEIFHLAPDTTRGKQDYDLFPAEAAAEFRAMDERVAAAGHALTEEETALQDDGPHVYLSVKAPLRDAGGKIYAVFGISTDITERKCAENALRESEARLRAQLERLSLLDQTTRAIADRQDPHSILQVVIRSLEENLPIDFGCVCLCDPTRSALTVTCVGTRSEPLATQLAMPEHAHIEVDGNGLSRCVGGALVYEPDLAPLPFPFSRRLAAAGLGSLVIAPLIVESTVFGVLVAARSGVGRFSSGECEFLRQLSEHVALALHQAELHGALKRAYDDLRETQQRVMQQERLRVLGQMASGIAHDINNALSPASLYLESLLDRDASLSIQAKEHLLIIQRAIEDVANTVARMRDFYRQRELQPTHAPLNLNRIVEQVVELTHPKWHDMAQERGAVIRLETDLAPGLPAILGTETEVRDALANLVLNAVDAMPEGGALTLRSGDAGSGRVRIEVLDSGVGMDEETRTRCLEPFFTTKGERGTGLGLAMVYGMLERHGGEIQIESEPGRGTRVCLTFPASPGAGLAESGKYLVPHALRPLRLLFIDDDPIVLKSLRDTMEQEGHSVVTADGGKCGIEVFRAAEARGERFAAVITDLGMPDVDGRKVAVAIKAHAPEVPVLLLTGWGHRLLSDNDRPEYVDRVLSKPPRLAELRLALAELTRGLPR